MRPYHPNSPQAMARIVALTLVSDGSLDQAELEMLKKMRAFDRLGMSEQKFVDVLQEFCHDLLTGDHCDHRDCQVRGEDLVRLLADVTEPHLQKETLRLMLDVIRADGRLDQGESMLFWQALEQWHLQISEIVLEPRKRTRRYPMATQGRDFKKPLVPRSPYGRVHSRA
jgi:uncharacterized tellurite resistance protein B-like protein